jgi:hypothetical protein
MRHVWKLLGGSESRCGTCGIFRTYQGRKDGSTYGKTRQAAYRRFIGDPWQSIQPLCFDLRQADVFAPAREREQADDRESMPEEKPRAQRLKAVAARPDVTAKTLDTDRAEWERALFVESEPEPARVREGDLIGLTFSRFGRMFGEQTDCIVQSSGPIPTISKRVRGTWPEVLDAVCAVMVGNRAYAQPGAELHLHTMTNRHVATWKYERKKWSLVVKYGCG